MGIEALLHSSIHSRHGKNTGTLPGTDGESLASGFAGLLQGHLATATRATDAADGKSAVRAIDGEFTLPITDAPAPDASLLAALTPAISATGVTVGSEVNTPTASATSAPASTTLPQGLTRDALAAAASALDAITAQNTPIDRPADTPSRSDLPATTPSAASQPAIVASGHFSEQLARATTRTAPPDSATAPAPANRQAVADETTAKAAIPAAASAATPAALNAGTAPTTEVLLATSTVVVRQEATPTPAVSADKLPPAQRTPISRAFAGTQPSGTSILPASAGDSAATPASVTTSTAELSGAAPTATTANTPVSSPPPGRPNTDILPAVKAQTELAPASAARPQPPLPGTQPNAPAAAPSRLDTSRAMPETAAQGPATSAQPALQAAQAPLPGVAQSNEMPAPAAQSAATTDTQFARRPAARISPQESRSASITQPGASNTDSDENLVASPVVPPVRSTAEGLPANELKSQAAAMTVTADPAPVANEADATTPPNDSAKLAAMPAATANGAEAAGLAAHGGADATANTETSVQLPTHLRDPRWGEHLGERVVVLAQGEKNSAQIDINPAQLGPIRVKIDMHGEQISVQFSSASPEVRQALEDALPRLREQLSNSGIQLGQANVGSQSQQTPREAFAQSTPSPRSQGEGAILPAESPLEVKSSGRLIQSGRGLVDLFA